MRLLWQRLKMNKLAVAGGIIVLGLFLVAMFASFISPYDPYEIDSKHVLESPSAEHFLGTDDLGRDVFSRMIYASRIALAIGFIAVGIATVIGIVLGALAGYYGNWVDRIIRWFTDTMLSIPTFFLILAVIAYVNPNVWNEILPRMMIRLLEITIMDPGILTIMIVIGLTSWMGVTRLVRAEFLSLKEREFVLAAKALGASNIRIIFRHIMVNSMSPVFVSAVFGVAGAILVESALSFLGLGVQPPVPSWGNILTLGKDNIEIAWWLSVFPGLAILITVLGYNLLGEGLRDALDPRLWGSERK